MRALRSIVSACIHRTPFATLQLSCNKQRLGCGVLGLALIFSLYGCGHKGPLIAPERTDIQSPEIIEASHAQPNTLQLPEPHSH